MASLESVARNAVEAGIYETGKAANDAAIRNEDLTADKLIAAAGHGLVFGGGLGGLMHVGSSAVGSLARRAASSEGSAMTGAVTDVEAAAAPGGLQGKLGEALQKGADVKTIKALGGSAGDIRTLENNVAGGYRRVAQDVRTDIEASTGKSIGFHTKESLHAYASDRVDELGEKLGSLLKRIDNSGSGIAPDVKGFADKVRQGFDRTEHRRGRSLHRGHRTVAGGQGSAP